MHKKAPSKLKIVSAAIIGHALEFYDFTIYAVFAVTLGKLFFPNSSELAQVLSSMGVFAAGFLMRPLGGIIFGHIGDKFGRRTSLTISVLLMAVLTFLIGILPDYHSIGILAPIILVTVRLLQGLCVGGEGVGASVFVLEHLNKVKPGLVGGIVNSALTLGILLAIITGLALTTYFGENSDAWRYAFIIGGLLGIIGLYIRLTVDETPEFEEVRRQNRIESIPIVAVFRENMNAVILTMAIGAFTSTSNYMIMSYLNVFYKTVMKYDASTALSYSILGNALLVITLILGGMLSDKLGYARQTAIGAVVAIIASPILLVSMADPNPYVACFGIFLFAVQGGLIYAPLYGTITRLFPPEQRYSGIACSLNIGIAAFGGPSSMIALWLVNYFDSIAAPSLFISLTAVIYLVALSYTKRVNILRLLASKRYSNRHFEHESQVIEASAASN